MKYLFILILSLSCTYSNAQKKRDFSAEKFIDSMVYYFNKKKDNEFNSLINKDLGVYLVTRMGTNDIWANKKKIYLESNKDNILVEELLTVPYQSILENNIIQPKLNNFKYSNASYYKCENIEREGVFISHIGKYHILSNTIKFFKEHYYPIAGEILGQKESIEMRKLYLKARDIERKSRRITINSKTSGTFIFYITLIKNKWYLTIIDFVSNDCSV